MSGKIPAKVSEIHLVYKTKTRAADRPQIRTSGDAYQVLKSNWSDQIELIEEFNVPLLDRSNRVMGMCPISKGGTAGTVGDLKIVFAAALKGRASSIILAHIGTPTHTITREIETDYVSIDKLIKRTRQQYKRSKDPNKSSSSRAANAQKAAENIALLRSLGVQVDGNPDEQGKLIIYQREVG